jgi:hypothetical protein
MAQLRRLHLLMFPNNLANATCYSLSDQNFKSSILYQSLYFGLIGDEIWQRTTFILKLKRNFYKDLIACLVVGVSCFLSLECVIKVTRKELLEWSNILLPFFLQCISFVIINYLLEIEIFSKKISYRKKSV